MLLRSSGSHILLLFTKQNGLAHDTWCQAGPLKLLGTASTCLLLVLSHRCPHRPRHASPCTGKLQSSQPGTPELRPASATARLLYGSSTSVSSPVRFGPQYGGGARIRPSSCSALPRGRSGGAAAGSRAVSARSHWHQRVTSTPAGASGAVVTPHSTGRVVPAATLQRPPPPSARRYSAADSTPAPLPAHASNAPPLPSMLAPKVRLES